MKQPSPAIPLLLAVLFGGSLGAFSWFMAPAHAASVPLDALQAVPAAAPYAKGYSDTVACDNNGESVAITNETSSAPTEMLLCNVDTANDIIIYAPRAGIAQATLEADGTRIGPQAGTVGVCLRLPAGNNVFHCSTDSATGATLTILGGSF